MQKMVFCLFAFCLFFISKTVKWWTGKERTVHRREKVLQTKHWTRKWFGMFWQNRCSISGFVFDLWPTTRHRFTSFFRAAGAKLPNLQPPICHTLSQSENPKPPPQSVHHFRLNTRKLTSGRRCWILNGHFLFLFFYCYYYCHSEWSFCLSQSQLEQKTNICMIPWLFWSRSCLTAARCVHRRAGGALDSPNICRRLSAVAFDSTPHSRLSFESWIAKEDRPRLGDRRPRQMFFIEDLFPKQTSPASRFHCWHVQQNINKSN